MIPSPKQATSLPMKKQTYGLCSGDRMIQPPPCQPMVGNTKKAYVYLLRNVKGDQFYIGWTTDVNRRLKEHNKGKSFHTKKYLPWLLIGYQIFNTMKEAKEYEKKLKNSSRMKLFFKKRLLENYNLDNMEKKRFIHLKVNE